MSSTGNRVSGKPSKAFFIDMIIRDLGVTDSILDLVDNSIGHAVTTSRVDVMQLLLNGHRPKLRRYYVAIRIGRGSFTVEDNCGGIPIEDARTRVFRFGDADDRIAEAGLSVYGIGMKRAFFKLGNLIRVQSATKTDWFVVDINAKRWKARGDDDWDFHFTQFGNMRQRHPYPASTTKITVSGLHKEIASRFDEPTFAKQLRETLAATYGLFLSAGLDISVNGVRVGPRLPSIGGFGKSLTPARRDFKTGTVETLLIVGVTPREDRRAHGWYVFCNGRMVLEADRSRITGWGDSLPQWHTKYNHFAGYVYFRSADVRSLPWTTTKQAIVLESSVYQAALAEMQVQARPVLNFLNNLYPDDLVEDEVEERNILTKAKSISITDLPRTNTPFSAPIRIRAKNDTVNIQYQKPKSLLSRIKQHLQKPRMSAGAIGSHTFDYFVNQELD